MTRSNSTHARSRRLTTPPATAWSGDGDGEGVSAATLLTTAGAAVRRSRVVTTPCGKGGSCRGPAADEAGARGGAAGASSGDGARRSPSSPPGATAHARRRRSATARPIPASAPTNSQGHQPSAGGRIEAGACVADRPPSCNGAGSVTVTGGKVATGTSARGGGAGCRAVAGACSVKGVAGVPLVRSEAGGWADARAGLGRAADGGVALGAAADGDAPGAARAGVLAGGAARGAGSGLRVPGSEKSRNCSGPTVPSRGAGAGVTTLAGLAALCASTGAAAPSSRQARARAIRDTAARARTSKLKARWPVYCPPCNQPATQSPVSGRRPAPVRRPPRPQSGVKSRR